jgi:antagonist of KipI
MSLLVVKPGLSCTIQDAGRRGHRSFGVPAGGAMDPVAYRIANLLCGNRAEEASLEITLHGLELLVEQDVLIALSGGGSTPSIEDIPLPLNRPLLVKAGALIRFLPSSSACRMYLGVCGGLIADRDLGSCSTYEAAGLGGIGGRRVRKEDRLQRGPSSELGRRIGDSLTRRVGKVQTGLWGAKVQEVRSMELPVNLRYTIGPEWEWMHPKSREGFPIESFKVEADSNRMGIRLAWDHAAVSGSREMVSSGVCPGTVQMAHDGTLLLLMSDAQTTGGYPRIVQIAEADLSSCAQLRPGDRVRFHAVGLAEAENALLELKKDIRMLGNAIRETFGRKA